MWEQLILSFRKTRLAAVCVIALVLGNCVGEFSRERLLSIEELDKGSTGILARKVGKDDGCDVGVLDPLIYQSDARIVDRYNGVAAF